MEDDADLYAVETAEERERERQESNRKLGIRTPPTPDYAGNRADLERREREALSALTPRPDAEPATRRRRTRADGLTREQILLAKASGTYNPSSRSLGADDDGSPQPRGRARQSDARMG